MSKRPKPRATVTRRRPIPKATPSALATPDPPGLPAARDKPAPPSVIALAAKLDPRAVAYFHGPLLTGVTLAAMLRHSGFAAVSGGGGDGIAADDRTTADAGGLAHALALTGQ